jgi:hypothetical protein
MGYMHILFPKFLRQALRERAHTGLTRRKGTGHNDAPSGRGCTCEYEGASL